MNVDTIKLPVRELAIGMQVVKLDRPRFVEDPEDVDNEAGR